MPLLPSHQEWLFRLMKEYQQGRSLALLFDYDGTLTPIVRHPSLAVLARSTRRILQDFSRLPEISVGVISGRPLWELENHVGLDALYYAGSGGLELDFLGVRRHFPESADWDGQLTRIHHELLETLQRYPGTWIEREPNSLSIHYRGLLPLAGVCFRAKVTDYLRQFNNVRWQNVSEALEIMPVDGWHKGTAITQMLNEMARNTGHIPLPVFFGDSANDWEGMESVIQIGGIAVGIGPDAPAIAQFHLADSVSLMKHLFDLRLHLSIMQGIECPAGDSTASDLNHNNVTSNKRLLIIDPDEIHRNQLTVAMEERGWWVWACSNLAHFQEYVADHLDDFQVVLVDLQFPGLQGARILADFAQSHPNWLRCGMAPASPYMVSAFQKLSHTPLFTKPIHPDWLNHQLCELLATVAPVAVG